MKREKIYLPVTDDTKIKVINYQVCSGSGRTAYIDIAIGAIVIRGVHVDSGGKISMERCVDFPQDIVLSKEIKAALENLALFSHIVEECREASFGELKSGEAYASPPG